MVDASKKINNHAGFIWSVADLLRGDYKQSEYGRVVLPLTVLRRLDCVLDPVKPAMLEKYGQVKGRVRNFGPLLDQLTDIRDLWNISKFDYSKLLDDPDHIADNLRAYVGGFSPEIRDIIDNKDLCRVHVKPSSFPVEATVTMVKDGQHSKKTAFYVRLNNKTHEFTSEDEKQKYIAQQWGSQGV